MWHRMIQPIARKPWMASLYGDNNQVVHLCDTFKIDDTSF